MQVSLSAFCFLFSEMVQYQQNKVNTTQELEKRLAENGYGTEFAALLVQKYKC